MSRCVRPGLSSALLLGLVMVSLAAVAARRLVSSLCCGLWPGQSLSVFCVSCLLSLVSCLLSLLSLVSCVRTLVACVRHIWSAIFILRLHCPVTPPHKNKWKKLFDIYLILPSFMASHFCSTKLENHKTILVILEQSEYMSFLLSTSICHIKQDSTF